MASSGADLQRSIERGVLERLAPIGFQRRRGLLVSEFQPEWLGWLGLNFETASTYRKLNPVIGVRYQKLERIVAQLSDTPFHESSPPSHSSPLGYLTPAANFLMWTFRVDEDITSQLNNVVDAIMLYGIPWIERHSSLSALHEDYKLDGWKGPERAPIVAALLGKFDEANARLDQTEREISTMNMEPNSYGSNMMSYVTKCRAWIAVSRASSAINE